jgi:hypothetical protein
MPHRASYPTAAAAASVSFDGAVLDNNLDPRTRARLLAELNNGRTSPEPHIAALAEQLAAYIQDKSLPLVVYRPVLWARSQRWLRALGEKVGRKRHRIVIMGLLLLDGILALLVAAFLVWAGLAIVAGNPNLPELQVTIDEPVTPHPIRIAVRLGLQALVSVLNLVALMRFWRGHEQGAVDMAIFPALLAFTVVNLLNFYVSQFGALASFFSNLAVLLVLLAYRAWYLAPPSENAW